MKQQILMAGSVACLLLVSSTVAAADDPGKDWMPMDKVISILKENG